MLQQGSAHAGRRAALTEKKKKKKKFDLMHLIHLKMQ
jgi:hypothetical protein